jgi:aspartyl-tRNA(Asn)/glutamyl-tRNA(Gln) amidotransferase subunit A
LDSHDNTTIDNAGQDYLADIDSGIEGKKIGIIQEMAGEGTDPEVRSATNDAVSKLEGLGATIIQLLQLRQEVIWQDMII